VSCWGILVRKSIFVLFVLQSDSPTRAAQYLSNFSSSWLRQFYQYPSITTSSCFLYPFTWEPLTPTLCHTYLILGFLLSLTPGLLGMLHINTMKRYLGMKLKVSSSEPVRTNGRVKKQADKLPMCWDSILSYRVPLREFGCRLILRSRDSCSNIVPKIVGSQLICHTSLNNPSGFVKLSSYTENATWIIIASDVPTQHDNLEYGVRDLSHEN
jgi:hypothetical protein